MDKISSLPDDVLGHVLSFLPTKQAASTSLLSKRWRNVYVLVSHIDLLSGHHIGDPKKFIDFVESLLNRQGDSPLKKLTFTYRFGVASIHVQRWICNALERGVMDIDLLSTFFLKSQPIPSLIFKSKTLTKLRLRHGFKILLCQDIYLPMLRNLCLDSVHSDGDQDVIETLLPRCPVLEELAIEEQSWVQGCRYVSSPSLKKLCIRLCNTLNISLDVPNLVYLELLCLSGSKYTIVNLGSLLEARLNLWVDDRRLKALRRGAARLRPADMIDLINGIKNVRVLHLTTGASELMYVSGQNLPMFNNLVCLSIESHKKQGWLVLPLLIKNSPNLETLIFKGLEHYISGKCVDACDCYDLKENSSCLLSSCRVKVLEICGCQGTSRELNIMKYFFKKLPCLELVKIRTVNNPQVPIDTQYLISLPRASPKCKIQVNF